MKEVLAQKLLSKEVEAVLLFVVVATQAVMSTTVGKGYYGKRKDS
jgi:hypothetical protein